jgi:putative membrane protein
MKSTHALSVSTLGIVLALAAAACGHDEPPKSAANEEAPAPAVPAAAPTQPAPMQPQLEANPTAGPTSADVPREGPNAGNAEAQPMPALTDGQILEVTHTANTAEIEQAKIALVRSKDARVRQFAQMMVRDHTQADDKGIVVARKYNLERQQSPASDSLRSDADGATQTLKADALADFDKDYVDTQVREHQAVLDTLDQKLIPTAQDPGVKSYLLTIRAAVASHLQHAEDLQRALQK